MTGGMRLMAAVLLFSARWRSVVRMMLHGSAMPMVADAAEHASIGRGRKRR